MLLKDMNREDEAIWGSFQNNDSADLVDGDLVIARFASTGNDLGRQIIGSAASAGQIGTVGVVQGDTIKIGNFGLVQVYGVHRNAKAEAAVNAAQLALQASATAKTIGTAAAAASAFVGFSLGAAVNGRAVVFLKCM